MRLFKIVCQVLGLVLALSLLAGCYCGTTGEALQPPGVLVSFPPDNARSIPIETDIQILFSKTMGEEATAKALIISPEIDHEILWEEDGRLMIIHPIGQLEFDTLYSVTITSEARSQDGLYMGEDHTFSFWTEKLTSPLVISTSPPGGAEGVPVETGIQVLFSKPMDIQATIQALIILPEIDYEISWDKAGRLMTIYPLRSWDLSTLYEITIINKAKSQDGLYMREDCTFSFQTAEERFQLPVVIYTQPAKQPAGSGVPIPAWSDIHILFSKPMDKEATTRALIISPKADYEVIWKEDGRLMIIQPIEFWDGGTYYEVIITGEARSEYGLYMGKDYTLSFLADPTQPC